MLLLQIVVISLSNAGEKFLLQLELFISGVFVAGLIGTHLQHRGNVMIRLFLSACLCFFIGMSIFAAHRLVSYCVQRNEAHCSGERPSGGPEAHVRHGKHVPLPLHRFPGAG